jgi:hypothetical protein
MISRLNEFKNKLKSGDYQNFMADENDPTLAF